MPGCDRLGGPAAQRAHWRCVEPGGPPARQDRGRRRVRRPAHGVDRGDAGRQRSSQPVVCRRRAGDGVRGGMAGLAGDRPTGGSHGRVRAGVVARGALRPGGDRVPAFHRVRPGHGVSLPGRRCRQGYGRGPPGRSEIVPQPPFPGIRHSASGPHALRPQPAPRHSRRVLRTPRPAARGSGRHWT